MQTSSPRRRFVCSLQEQSETQTETRIIYENFGNYNTGKQKT